MDLNGTTSVRSSRPASCTSHLSRRMLFQENSEYYSEKDSDSLVARFIQSRPATGQEEDWYWIRPLHQVARDGDVRTLEYALKRTPEGNIVDAVNLVDADGLTPLHYAARYWRYDMAVALVNHGADPSKIDPYNPTSCLHSAAMYKSVKIFEHAEDQSAVLDGKNVLEPKGSHQNELKSAAAALFNVDPMKKEKQSFGQDWVGSNNRLPPVENVPLPSSSTTTLSRNESFEESTAMLETQKLTASTRTSHTLDRGVKDQPNRSMIKFLVDLGVDINYRDFFQMTPLHIACKRGSSKIVKELLHCPGVDIHAIDAHGAQPLHNACVYGYPKIVNLLIERGADLTAKDKNGSTPLHTAVWNEHKDVVEILLNSGKMKFGILTYIHLMTDATDTELNTPLCHAAQKGSIDICQLLIDHRANPNLVNNFGNTPLHAAASEGEAAVCEILLKAGAKVGAQNKQCQTPLHLAAIADNADCIKVLLDSGAAINATDSNNSNPLLLAARFCRRAETIEHLLRSGAAVDVLDKDENTVLILAAKSGNLAALEVLLQHPVCKAIVNRANRRDTTALHLAAKHGHVEAILLLLSHGGRVDVRDQREATPLHVAAGEGHRRAVEILLEVDPTVVDEIDENCQTALLWACFYGFPEVAKVLLEAEAYPESRDPTVITPLADAAMEGHLECGKILLEHGASVNSDGNKSTPILFAAQQGHADFVKLLLSQPGLDLTVTDDDGYNALELAVKKNHRKAAQVILESEHWYLALSNERVSKTTGARSTPLRMLIKRMPDVAEIAFQKCVTTSQDNPDFKDFAITYDYSYLEDSSWALKSLEYIRQNRCGGSYWEEKRQLLDEEKEKARSPGCWGSRKSSSATLVKKQKDEAFRDELHMSKELFTKARESAKVMIDLKRNHPLSIMVRYSRTNLLNHPLSRALVNYKWRKFGRYIYYTNLGFYSIFLTFLTGYVLTTPAPVPVVIDESKGSFYFANECPRNVPELQEGSLARYIFAKVGRKVIFIMAALNLARELFQLIQRNFLLYFDFENLLEWTCYVTALIFVYNFTECSSETGLREPWQWQVGAAAIFLAWLNLLLFIKKFPFFGLYVLMFTDIFRTFSKFFLVFFFFVVGFALAFHVLLQQQVPFRSPGEALVKTFVMMIGEMDFESIFYDAPDRKVYYPGITYALFIGFMLVMSIIIMNLLVGLAVDDIKAVQDRAALERLAMQVKMVLEVEAMLPNWIRKRCIAITERVTPNSNKSLFSNNNLISESLAENGPGTFDGERDESDLRRLQENFQKFKMECRDTNEALNRQLKSLSEQNQQMSVLLYG